MPYKIQVQEPRERWYQSGTADDIVDALEAAWVLGRYYEAPTEIIDEDDHNRVVAVVKVEWKE